MKNMKLNHVVGMLVVAGVLTGCGSDDDTMTSTYEVQVNNLTHAQPLSPVGVLLHSEETQIWSIGAEASIELEDLAEGGSNAALLAVEDDYLEVTASGEGLIMPGQSETITLSVSGESSNKFLSVVTMLVNTNDAFTGTSGLDISDLDEGESRSLRLGVYDAGTEVNDELVNTIPGQMGEGFNAERLDSNKVSRHPGVVGSDDGYADSVLTSLHKFDNPAVSLNITRIN